MLQNTNCIAKKNDFADSSKENKYLQTKQISWSRQMNGTRLKHNLDKNLNVSHKIFTDSICANNISCITLHPSHNTTEYDGYGCTNGKAMCHKYIKQMFVFYQNVSMRDFFNKKPLSDLELPCQKKKAVHLWH